MTSTAQIARDDAVEISELCLIADRADLVPHFIREGRPPAEVRKLLLDLQRSTAPVDPTAPLDLLTLPAASEFVC